MPDFVLIGMSAGGIAFGIVLGTAMWEWFNGYENYLLEKHKKKKRRKKK